MFPRIAPIFVLLGSLCCVSLRAGATTSAPHLIFIEVDDLVYSYTGPWGCKTAKTPTMDRLAREGFVFDQASAQGMMCGPSRNSLVSGRYPHQMGFYQNGQMRSLPQNVWTLPAALQRAGYYTAWIGKSHLKPWTPKRGQDHFKASLGFDHAMHTLGRAMLGREEGFEAESVNPYEEHLKRRGLLEQYRDDLQARRNSTLPVDDYLDGWFARMTVDFIRDYHGQKPLFLWVNFSVPHEPCDVPDSYHAPFASVAMPGLSRPSNFTHPESLIRRTRTVRTAEAAIAEQRLYHANIYFMDEQVGRILRALEERKILDSAWIVFFSDQGKMMGAHGLLHKNTLFRQITQPALIIRPPGGLRQGVRVAQPVELLDLLPTTLALAKARSEACPAGISLLPVFRGEASGRSHAFGEIEDWIVVTDGRHRLIRSVREESPLLFDDRTDPENLTNLADRHPEIVQTLGRAIDEWLKRTGPRLPPRSQ